MMRSLLAVIFAGLLFAAPASAANPVVIMETAMGTVKIELYPDKVPATVKHFLAHVDDKYYDGTIFHRVIPDFMIQGGGFEQGLKEKDMGGPIKNESANGLSNLRGTVAMARTSNPDSARAQFFINVKDNKPLDRDDAGGSAGYCVFGKVIEGMEVVDKIRSVKTTNQGSFQNLPVDQANVLIKSIRLADAPQDKK